MKLPIPFLGKNEEPEFLLALLLRQEKATAVIIEEQKKGSRIVGKHEEYFQTNLEDATEEELLKILDQTISKAEETLPSNIETHKTIFGVPASWVEEKHIKKEYLLKLKKTSEELTLTPIGFLEIPEAIAHLLMEEEGAPVSAILTEIGKEYLSVSLIRGGKVIDTKFGKVEETAAKDVDRILRLFENVEIFPSRIIIFNGGYDDKLVQTLIAHQWSKSLPFLHVPQISILPQGFDAKAVVFGAATQMGFDISGAFSMSHSDIKTFHQTLDTKNAVPAPIQNDVSDIAPKAPKEKPVPTTKTIEGSPESSQFGFVKDQDIATLEETEAPTEKEKQREQPMEKKREEEGRRAAFTIHSPYPEESNIKIPSREENFTTEDLTQDAKIEEKPNRLHPLLLMPQSLVSLFRARNLPSLPQNRLLLILLPVVLVVLLGLLGAYIYLLQGTITVLVSPKGVDKNTGITFVTEGKNDFEHKMVKAKTTSISLSGSTSTQVLGKKEIGTKAKGTVTLFNSADVKKQLQQGAVITSTNDLAFTLDKDVMIASATGDIFTGIKSGTSEVGITAKQIGSEYNVPSNIKFTLGNNSSLAAKNEQAFSGGSKKNVTVVSQADIDKVTTSLPKTLESKGRDTLSKKISGGETLLTVVANFKPSKKDFSDSLGNEAKTLTLTSSVTFEAISYDNTDLLSFTKSLIKDTFDKNLTVSDQDIQNTIKNIEQKDETSLNGTLTMRAKLLPKIDTEKLAKTLAGRSFGKAKETLLSYPQVADVTISLFPPVPFLPLILPRQAGNITITIKTNE